MTFQPGQSGNPSGRPKGSVNRQLALLREAVEQVLPLVVERAINGDHEAQKLILEKGLPKLKAVEAPVEFALPEAGAQQPARQILVQASEGNLSLPAAQVILNALLPVASQEQEAIERKGQGCPAIMNAYLSRLMA